MRRMLSKENGKNGMRILDRRIFHSAVSEEFSDFCKLLRKSVEGSDGFRMLFLRRMDALCGVSAPKEK